MPSVFVNRNGRQNRRNIRSLQGVSGGTIIVERELILIPDFDTFIFHQDPNIELGTDRWNFINNGARPDSSEEIPVALFNPWNDGMDAPNDANQAPRTPTRTILGFNMSGVSAGVEILSAELKLTLARMSNWMGTT